MSSCDLLRVAEAQTHKKLLFTCLHTVDKAFLDLQPYALQDLPAAFTQDFTPRLSHSSTDTNRCIGLNVLSFLLALMDKSLLKRVQEQVHDSPLVHPPPLLACSHLSALVTPPCRVHSGAVQSVFSTLMRRLGLNPWLPLDTDVTPRRWDTSPVDMSDEDFLAQHTSTVTYMPLR